jgi:hypothetical protein
MPVRGSTRFGRLGRSVTVARGEGFANVSAKLLGHKQDEMKPPQP